MKNQFVPYEIALDLKELGFDDFKMFGWYIKEDDSEFGKSLHTIDDRAFYFNVMYCFKVPLWQQVIDWLRKTYKIHIYIVPNGLFDEPNYIFRIDSKDRMLILDKLNNVYSFIGDWKGTYEEAREAATRKAIEIIKNK